MFKLLRNCQTVFQSACTIFRSHQQCVRVPVSPHPRQHLLLFVFLIIATLVGVECCLMGLICTFLLANGVEHFSCACWTFVYLHWRNAYSNSLLIFNWIIYLFAKEFEFFIYSGYESLITYVTYKCFFPFCELSFNFLNGMGLNYFWCPFNST